jgi:MFS family permease
MSLCLYFLSIQTSILQFYFLYFLFGAFGCALLFSPLYANVGFWFRQNPGLALGIAASGGAIGQAFIPHLSGYLIEAAGWKSAYLNLAVIYIVIALPISLLIKESPWRESARTEEDPEVRDFPISEKEVVAWISLAVIFCCICMSVPIVHLVPLLTDANSKEKFASVSKGTRWTIGTDIQIQQKITARLIQATTSFSEIGKSLTSGSSSVRALSLQGDSFISREIGSAITI